MRTKEEWTRLFVKLGVTEPEQWAAAEVAEDLGNLPRVAFLRQAWDEIPRSTDVEWLEKWMHYARKQHSESDIVAAYERMVALGVPNEDLILILRGVMGRFLYRLCYLLDDPSLEDEEIEEAARWGLYHETDAEEPIRRLGCIHELVFSVDPESTVG
jgi:hypothetical protein